MWKIEEVTMYRVYDEDTGQYADGVFEEEWEAEDCIAELIENENYKEMVRNERW